MRAFVVGGGGNVGSMQVGALQVLMEAGIRPDLLVGASAGALNAAFLGGDPTPTGAQRLGTIWEQATKADVYPGGILQVALHLLTHRDSLYPSDSLRRFLERHIPAEHRFFHKLSLPTYIVATDLRTGRVYLFGEDLRDTVLDAVLASTAAPPLRAPWPYRDHLLVDGSVAANVPIHVAVQHGATEIYALEVWRRQPSRRDRWTLLDIAAWTVRALMYQQWERDLSLYAASPAITLHHLPLYVDRRLAFDDFSQADALIAQGRIAAETYLNALGLTEPVERQASSYRRQTDNRLPLAGSATCHVELPATQ